MDITSFLIALFLVRSIRSTLKSFPHPLKWDQWVKGGMTFIVFLLVAEMFAHKEHYVDWVWIATLLTLVYIVYQEKELHSLRPFSLTILPYIGVMFVKDLIRLINVDAINKWSDYVQTAQVFAGIWIFASWFTANRQQKALEKERVQRRQEEELNKQIAARKVELEVLVQERTAALSQQKEELQQALADLRTTQDQLIQSEKLASLGELTAGIAHEIQNPLNFVNNFSEVSIELLEEMEEELQKGAIKEALEISADIKQNLQKIYHHGKRADGIVKGMLQHSRNNSGERQLTDINILADEYLRLSYHGLRAKDKSFNATLTTHFQENLPKVNIVPQDIGRVLLNLFNNAFYAVQQKQKTAGPDYKPEVRVDTSFTGTFLVIKVKDNGIGIPEAVKDKILQPFFTTKPTGEGTGLGLSLSYDIVVKGHGGRIEVESEKGKGSEFLIALPLNKM
ncbi:MAG: sensor histidine kinase [Mucilaginibacter sp.]|uniref:sensor histidine kinase n=1 Tax=Mucilaginibacter sp. TaxID=1882438 RepID=UPI0034E5997F